MTTTTLRPCPQMPPLAGGEEEEYANASDPDDASMPVAYNTGALGFSGIASMPKAKLTADDDSASDAFEEGLGSEDDDGDGFSAVTRVLISDQYPVLGGESDPLASGGDDAPSDTQVSAATDEMPDANPKSENRGVATEDQFGLKDADNGKGENLIAESEEAAGFGTEREVKSKTIAEVGEDGANVSSDKYEGVPKPMELNYNDVGSTKNDEGNEETRDENTPGFEHAITGIDFLLSELDQGAIGFNGTIHENVPVVAKGSMVIPVQDSQTMPRETSENSAIERDEVVFSGTIDENVSAVVEKTSNGQSQCAGPEPELGHGSGYYGSVYLERNLSCSEVETESLTSDEPPSLSSFGSSEHVKQMIKALEEGSLNSSDVSSNKLMAADRQILFESDEDVEREKVDEQEVLDSSSPFELSSSVPYGSTHSTLQGANKVILDDHPIGLGSSVASLKPAPTSSARTNLLAPSDIAVTDDDMTNEEQKMHDKVESIRVKFVRLVHRLGHYPEESVAAQVLYRLILAEGIHRGGRKWRTSILDGSKKKALQLEVDGVGLDFFCSILVLGKSGVGKSATINSLFDEEKLETNAFEPSTALVREIVGSVAGVKIRVIDTPGLRASAIDQASNRRILASIRKHIQKCPPDIVLYVDRIDARSPNLNDLPLLKSISSSLGPSIWFKTIIALTHAASAPPDGPSGSPLSYEMFVTQGSHAIQQTIRLAAGDMHLMNSVALVENHQSCRRNKKGQRVLPNGLTWRSNMLLLCFSSKILSEANSLLKVKDSSPAKLFGFRLPLLPLPFLLSSLLQSRQHPRLPYDQMIVTGDYSDIDLDDLSDTEEQEEDEYNQLPPFRSLRKSQINELTKEQRMAYFDEYDYRVKLLQKKQWKDAVRKLKEVKRRKSMQQEDYVCGDTRDEFDEDSAPATVPIPMPDMTLPPSFDSDSPTYRYRFLEPTSQLLVRPVLHAHGWDHDNGYDGLRVEENLVFADRFPAALSGQFMKDKKEFNIHFDSSVSTNHGENGSTLLGFDIQTIGKKLCYILRGETEFKNLKKNKTAGGISITLLGETVATGIKFEDELSVGNRVNLAASAGAVRAQGETAFGANLEARLKDKDYPIVQVLTTLGFSLMSWHGDLALGANLQSQFDLDRNSKMAVLIDMNNKMTGRISIKTSTSEQLQLAAIGIVPIVISIFRSMRSGQTFTS